MTLNLHSFFANIGSSIYDLVNIRIKLSVLKKTMNLLAFFPLLSSLQPTHAVSVYRSVCRCVCSFLSQRKQPISRARSLSLSPALSLSHLYLSLYLSIYLFLYLSICLPLIYRLYKTYIYICIYHCLSICLSQCLRAHLRLILYHFVAEIMS